MDGLISHQQAVDALNEIINRFEQILRDIRESKIDDSVCGMCEYDGAYIGQSGDWCNECPGFDKDDCFKLSDECRKRWLKSVDLPSAQPEPRWIPVEDELPEEGQGVLVTDEDGGIDIARIIDYSDIGEGIEWWAHDYKCNPTAWSELPKPYERSGDGKERR